MRAIPECLRDASCGCAIQIDYLYLFTENVPYLPKGRLTNFELDTEWNEMTRVTVSKVKGHGNKVRVVSLMHVRHKSTTQKHYNWQEGCPCNG